MRVELAAETGRHFESVDRLHRRRDVSLGLALGRWIAVEDGQELASIVQAAGDLVQRSGLLPKLGELFHDELSGIRIVPEIVRARALVELGYAAARCGIVKDAP